MKRLWVEEEVHIYLGLWTYRPLGKTISYRTICCLRRFAKGLWNKKARDISYDPEVASFPKMKMKNEREDSGLLLIMYITFYIQTHHPLPCVYREIRK